MVKPKRKEILVKDGLDGLEEAFEEKKRKPRKNKNKDVVKVIPGADAVLKFGDPLPPPPSQPPADSKPATPATATPPPAKTVTVVSEALPDLTKISAVIMTAEEKATADAKVATRKNWAVTAGEKLATIASEIAEIEAIPLEDLELDTDRKNRLIELKTAREQLLAAAPDEGIRKHVEFAQLMASVKAAKAGEAQKWMVEAEKQGRIRTTVKNTGSNLIFWFGKNFEPVPDAAGKATPATLGLCAELRKLTDAAKTAEREQRNTAISALKTEATPGMTLTTLLSTNPPAGKIYVFLPPKEEEIRGEKRWIGSSHILVICDGKIIRPVEAVGRLGNFFSELVDRKRFITVSDLKGGRYTGPRVAEDVFRDIIGFLNILRAAMHAEVPAAKTPLATPPTGK